MFIVEPPENYQKPPQAPAMPPELQKAKERMEKGRQSRDVIRALADLAAEARAHRDEIQKLTGRQSRGAVKRTRDYIAELVAKYQKAYARPLEDPELRNLFDEAVQDINEMELRRAAVFETAQARAERDEVLALDLSRRLAEVRENPDRLEESIYDRKTCLALQLQGEEYKARLQQDESTLAAAAVNARLDRNDVGGAEFDLVEFRDRFAEEDRREALDKLNRLLIQAVRLLPWPLRLVQADRHFTAVAEALEENMDDDGRKELALRRREAAEALQQDYQSYLDDPMKYLNLTVLPKLKEIADQGRLDPYNKAEVLRARSELAMGYQRRIGGALPRVTTNKEADELGQQFIEAAYKEKVGLVRQWAEEFGDLLPEVLSEIKLPHGTGHGLAAEWAAERDDLPQAWLLMEAADKKPADFKLTPSQIEEARCVSSAALAESGFGRVLAGILACSPDEMGMLSFTAGVRSLMLKLTLGRMETGLDAPSAAVLCAGIFDQRYGGIADEEIGFVFFPAGLDTKAIKTGLKRILENFPDPETALRWISQGPVFGLIKVGEGRSKPVLDINGSPIQISPMEALMLGHGKENPAPPVAEEKGIKPDEHDTKETSHD